MKVSRQQQNQKPSSRSGSTRKKDDMMMMMVSSQQQQQVSSSTCDTRYDHHQHQQQQQHPQEQAKQAYGSRSTNPVWEIPPTSTATFGVTNSHDGNNQNHNNNNSNKSIWKRIFPWKPCNPTNTTNTNTIIQTTLSSSSSTSLEIPHDSLPTMNACIDPSTMKSMIHTTERVTDTATSETSNNKDELMNLPERGNNNIPTNNNSSSPNPSLEPSSKEQTTPPVQSNTTTVDNVHDEIVISNHPIQSVSTSSTSIEHDSTNQISLPISSNNTTNTIINHQNHTTTTTATTTSSTTNTTTKHPPQLPPQSPRITSSVDRRAKLPSVVSQRSITTSSIQQQQGLPPPSTSSSGLLNKGTLQSQVSTTTTTTAVSTSRPNTISNSTGTNQRNLSFSSTGSRHRRSSADIQLQVPNNIIMEQLQFLSLNDTNNNNDQNNNNFDQHSTYSTINEQYQPPPHFRRSGSSLDALGLPPPPPPPPLPPMEMIDQAQCIRRVSILSDFDSLDLNDNNNDIDDDDHLFDLSSDEEEDDDENHDNKNSIKKSSSSSVAPVKSPTTLMYQHSYDSKDTCSVSPTTVIIPSTGTAFDTNTDDDIVPPSGIVDANATGGGTNSNATPDWMLEWAAATSTSLDNSSNNNEDKNTPSTSPLVVIKHKDEKIIRKSDDNDNKNHPTKLQVKDHSKNDDDEQQYETASCSTSTISTTDEQSILSNHTSISNFIYLPIEPIPTKSISSTSTVTSSTTTNDRNRNVVFCAGWAVVIWDIPKKQQNDNENTFPSLPKIGYDSLYYIELLQDHILRCTSAITMMSTTGDANEQIVPSKHIVELKLDQESCSLWSVLPVTPTQAGSCLAIQFNSMYQNIMVNQDTDSKKCYILPVHVSKRMMERIWNNNHDTKLNKKEKSYAHTFWYNNDNTMNVPENDGTNRDTNDNNHYTTSTISPNNTNDENHSNNNQNDNDLLYQYAPQEQQDAVIFLRLALDAALRRIQ